MLSIEAAAAGDLRNPRKCNTGRSIFACVSLQYRADALFHDYWVLCRFLALERNLCLDMRRTLLPYSGVGRHQALFGKAGGFGLGLGLYGGLIVAGMIHGVRLKRVMRAARRAQERVRFAKIRSGGCTRISLQALEMIFEACMHDLQPLPSCLWY